MQAFIAIGGILVLVSAVLAALGFRGREQIVGIDLGTTFSVVAVRSRDRYGNSQITVLPDRFSGRPLVPSVVTYLPTNDSVIVGDAAVALRSRHPQNTVFNAKRFIGRPWSEVADDRLSFPFNITADANGSAGFLLPLENGEQRWVSPIDIGSEVVKYIKKSILDYMGYEISRAVICVPAKFTDRETKATVEAFTKAGFKVMRVLDEPTSAAVAYGLHKKSGIRHTLVYDIGGGTLDASLLYLNGKAVSVLGVAGDDHLGGSDFDLKLRGVLMDKVHAAPKVPREQSDSSPSCDIVGLHILAEKAKIQLSSSENVEVTCLDEDGSSIRRLRVSRAEFEDACSDLFARALAPVHKVLTDQMMEPSDVHDIVLVGGASRTPRLRELLQDFFGPQQMLHTEIDPDVTVAYGAASIVD